MQIENFEITAMVSNTTPLLAATPYMSKLASPLELHDSQVAAAAETRPYGTVKLGRR